MNREVHVRIWERPEVRAPRATRHRTNPLSREGGIEAGAFSAVAVSG